MIQMISSFIFSRKKKGKLLKKTEKKYTCWGLGGWRERGRGGGKAKSLPIISEVDRAKRMESFGDFSLYQLKKVLERERANKKGGRKERVGEMVRIINTLGF